MLSDITQGGIGYDADLLDVFVVISHKAKMARHCPKALPSRKGGDLDDETGETSPLFNVGINRLRELHKVAFFKLGFGSHIENGIRFVEAVFDHAFAPMNAA